jgi:hypothetical protein
LPLHGVLQVCVPGSAWPQAEVIVRELGFGDGPAAPDVAADPGWLPA